MPILLHKITSYTHTTINPRKISDEINILSICCISLSFNWFRGDLRLTSIQEIPSWEFQIWFKVSDERRLHTLKTSSKNIQTQYWFAWVSCKCISTYYHKEKTYFLTAESKIFGPIVSYSRFFSFRRTNILRLHSNHIWRVVVWRHQPAQAKNFWHENSGLCFTPKTDIFIALNTWNGLRSFKVSRYGSIKHLMWLNRFCLLSQNQFLTPRFALREMCINIVSASAVIWRQFRMFSVTNSFGVQPAHVIPPLCDIFQCSDLVQY